MTRPEIHANFTKRFSVKSSSSVRKISDANLAGLERKLGIELPQSYRDFVVIAGPVWTPKILDLTVEQEFGFPDLKEFLTPRDCVETTESYREAGMSERLIAFANDCMGNVFCFEEGDLVDGRPDDVPVWFFDHDFCSDRRISDSFDSWLAKYLTLR